MNTWDNKRKLSRNPLELRIKRIKVSQRNSKSIKSEFQEGDILYGKLRPYLNRVLVADQCGYSTTEIVSLRSYLSLCSEYFAIALKRPDFVNYVTRLGQGTKIPHLRTEDAKVAAFPLPPLAEQHRIAKKFDELITLSDQLEIAIRTADKIQTSLLTPAFEEVLVQANTK